MSSPFRSSDRSPSSQRSTPSRQLQNGNRRVNGYHRESLTESPSRQLLEEFSLLLINDDRNFKRSLDEQSAAQQKLHLEALDRALAKHEEVRESAERARERVELEIERERRRRGEEERKAVEKARRELEEQKLAEQRRQLEETRAREEERKKQEAIRREQEDAKRRAESQKQQEEEERARKARQEKEEADRKARQDAEERQRQQQAENGIQAAAQRPSAPGLVPNGTAASSGPVSVPLAAPTAPSDFPQGLVSSTDEREAIHNRYLELHKRLKQMREHVSEETKKVPGLKNQLSDWRRAIHKCCGQLSKGTTPDIKNNNQRAMKEIIGHLDKAAEVSTPTIDVTQFLVQNQQPPDSNTQGPACLVFLLNHLAKNVISQFVSESSIDPKMADITGVLAVTIFARPQYLFNGQSLIDILWAKYHKHCPILFGMNGSEKTQKGRLRIGWHTEGGAFVASEAHYNRMAGLSAGFAAITLRDFSKSKNSNPAPNRIFWESIARIINIPAQEVQPTHFTILKAMIENSVPRIIGMFGQAGLAVLREALIAFPRDKGQRDEKGRPLPSVTALASLPVVLQRDLHLTL